MRSSVIVTLALLCVLSSTLAFGWGSLSGFETHQFIANAAYDLLEKDPAFDRGAFPRRTDVIANEGVYWSGSGQNRILRGPGPDSEGASPDSDHYYNPRNGKGTGPQAAARWLKTLAMNTAMVGETMPPEARAKTAKSAAWGAHFLADMSVYYHTNGMTYEDTEAAYAAVYDPLTGNRSGPILLDGKVTGDLDALSFRLKPHHNNDFTLELVRFLTEARKPGNKHKNYFDPWYWNGVTSYDANVNSTHMNWEMEILHNVMPTYALKGFSPRWKNSMPDFDRALDQFENAAQEFARGSARATQDTLIDAYVGGVDSRDRAIQDVHTLWRATQTGLRCGLQTQEDSENGTPPEFKDGKMTMTVQAVVGNLSSEDATGVKVRLVPIEGVEILDGDRVQEYGTLSGGVREPKFFGSWKVRVAKKNKVLAEVIGAYKSTPDLQYFGVTDRLVDVPDLYRGSLSGADGEISLKLNDKGSYTGTIKGTSKFGQPFEGSFGGRMASPTSFMSTVSYRVTTIEAGQPVAITLGGLIQGMLMDKNKGIWKGNWGIVDDRSGDPKPRLNFSGTFQAAPTER